MPAPPFSCFSRRLLRMLSGPVVWALHFLLIYGLTGILCARPALRREWLGISAVAWGIVLASMLAIAAIAILHHRAWRAWRHARGIGFVEWIAAAAALLALLAIVWETMPVLLLPACG